MLFIATWSWRQQRRGHSGRPSCCWGHPLGLNLLTSAPDKVSVDQGRLGKWLAVKLFISELNVFLFLISHFAFLNLVPSLC